VLEVGLYAVLIAGVRVNNVPGAAFDEILSVCAFIHLRLIVEGVKSTASFHKAFT
jgi:hypothetical protein